METYNIQGVEIFSEGKWNGETYTQDDLQEMVKAFGETKDGIRPYVKLGHPDKQKLLQKEGLPAAGWIDNLYIKGTKLVADFSDVPKKIYELIQKKAYRKVSSEIFWNIEVGKKKYSRMLGAVALLGSEHPGVYDLSDILANYYRDESNPPKTYEDQAIELIFKIEKTKTYTGKESEMSKTENEIKLELELKAKADEAASKDVELKKFTADLEAKDQELADLKKFKSEAEARELKLSIEAEQAKLSKFVTELEAEKLCTPAMKDMVSELLGPDKKEYSIKIQDKEEKLNKEQLLKEVLKLFKAAKEVNFAESSKSAKGKGMNDDMEKAMDEKAKKYAKENNCTYGAALKAIQKEQ